MTDNKTGEALSEDTHGDGVHTEDNIEAIAQWLGTHFSAIADEADEDNIGVSWDKIRGAWPDAAKNEIVAALERHTAKLSARAAFHERTGAMQ